MTKQEYEAKYAECNNWLGNIRVCKQYIASLEAEVANLNDWLTTWKESFNLAQAEIAKLWKHLAEANNDYEHLMAERNLTQAENESLITKIAKLKAQEEESND